MAGEIFMPQLGLTMSEGVLVEWLKDVGDPIKIGEPIMLVETDKATQEVTALEDGILTKIVVEAGTTVPVGTILAYLNTAKIVKIEAVQKSNILVEQQSPRLPIAPRDIYSSPVRVLASPLARKVAAEKGIRLEDVKGKGPGGRILVSDVEKFIDSSSFRTVQEPTPTIQPVALPVPRPAVPVESGRVVELQGLKKITAERMAYSFSTVPHFYLTTEVDVGNLVEMRKKLLPIAREKLIVEITYSDLIIKVLALALYEQPHVNAVWNNGKINEIPEVSVGIATAIGEGLIVPVISNADHLSLLEIAKQRSVLVEKARAGKLTLRDLEGGTFTLSNLGMYGIDLFQAIINPPQAAILAIGRIKDKPVVIDGDITIRPMMFVSLSSDHRILDGVTAAKFLNRVTELLENPMELLLSGG